MYQICVFAAVAFLATFVPLRWKVRRDAPARASWTPEQRQRARRWWNRLDYLWVSLAALGVFEGLLTAGRVSAQHEIDLRERYVESSRSIAQQAARGIGSSLARLGGDPRLEPGARDDYQVGVDYCQRAVLALAEALTTQEWSRFATGGVEAAALREHPFKTGAGMAVLEDADLVTGHVDRLRESLESLSAARSAAQDPELWRAARGLFPFLLAAALGIRLAIVSAKVNELA